MKTKKKDKTLQMKRLIDTALERFNADELISMLADKVKHEEREDMIREMAQTVAYEGFFVVKINSLSESMKLEDFAKENICTSYNEQMNNLFTY